MRMSLTSEEAGVLHSGLAELIRTPSLVTAEHFRQVVYVLATAAFVGPLQRGEAASMTAKNLADEFAPEIQERWVPLIEAVEYLKARWPEAGRSADTLRRWCRDGVLPEYARRKVGRNWQVELEELERFLLE